MCSRALWCLPSRAPPDLPDTSLRGDRLPVTLWPSRTAGVRCRHAQAMLRGPGISPYVSPGIPGEISTGWGEGGPRGGPRNQRRPQWCSGASLNDGVPASPGHWRPLHRDTGTRAPRLSGLWVPQCGEQLQGWASLTTRPHMDTDGLPSPASVLSLGPGGGHCRGRGGTAAQTEAGRSAVPPGASPAGSDAGVPGRRP